jgi:hypothetical protein
MDNTEKRSSYLPLSIFRVPRYRYFPTHLMDKCGPEQWERMRILQACERLEIPTKLWPKISFPHLPRQLAVRSYLPIKPEKLERLDFPPFSWLEETISDWKRRCHERFDVYLQEYAEKFEAQFQEALMQGAYKKIPSTRDTTPINLRYEWAARRFCYRTLYRKLADPKSGYSEERVKHAVRQILKKAGLTEGI